MKFQSFVCFFSFKAKCQGTHQLDKEVEILVDTEHPGMALHHKSGIPCEFHPHCILQCLLFAGGPATQEKSANILKQMSDMESWIKK